MKLYDVPTTELNEGCKIIERLSEKDMPRNVDWSKHTYYDAITKHTSFEDDTREGLFWRVESWAYDFCLEFDHGYLHKFIKFEWNKCYDMFNKDWTYKNVVDNIMVIFDTIQNVIIIRHFTDDREKLLNHEMISTRYLYDNNMVDVSSSAAYYRIQEIKIPTKSFLRRDVENLIYKTFKKIKELKED